MKAFLKGLAAASLLIASSAHAYDYTVGDLTIEHPWSRATVAGMANGAGYFVIENKGQSDDVLLSANTDIAKTTELHTHIQDGEVMRMRQVENVPIPAGEKVMFQPGGLHVMMMGLNQALNQGESFSLTLQFEKSGSVTMDVIIDKAGIKQSTASHDGHDHHDHDHDDHSHH